ncbi:glycosyltransferase [Geomonas oryzisoli]|uniref:Glycosyltransferase n=1 Tax=Geomonas oryzisoli TaxID=2847992 RepID=A0ABX8J8Y9_9BACT|nr:glycosyltransferase [Geomonas oryzisoli]QWV94803.1 glycosyltransferase [Geomonas oryzisoli]
MTKYDRNGASSRLRTYQFLPHLERAGCEVTVSPLFGKEYLAAMYAGRKPRAFYLALRAYLQRLKVTLATRRYDLVWIQKEAFPFLPPVLERILVAQGIPYAVDLDDAIAHVYDQHRLFPVRAALGGKIPTVMANAALVIAGNAYLAEQAQRSGARNISVIPTVVDLHRYPLLDAAPRGSKEIRIGWIGTPFTSKYLDLVHPALRDLARTTPLRLVTVGGAPSFDDVPTEFIPWSETTEVDALRSFDLGIMPLPDTPFERGKCGYKLIQCLALAKPVIASPVGVNIELLTENRCGLLAHSDAEWTAAIGALLSSELRREMGHAGRAAVEAKYSLQSVGDELAETLRRTVRDAAKRRVDAAR